MKLLTEDGARSWCDYAQGVRTTINRFPYLYFSLEHPNCIQLDPNWKPYQALWLARFLLLPFAEDSPFAGALIWVRSWGIWDRDVEAFGFRILDYLRGTSGDKRGVEEAPGYLFDATETMDAQVCLSLPILVGWDAFMVAASGEYFAFVSHDEPISIIFKGRDVLDRHLQYLKESHPDWSPREDASYYFRSLR